MRPAASHKYSHSTDPPSYQGAPLVLAEKCGRGLGDGLGSERVWELETLIKPYQTAISEA